VLIRVWISSILLLLVFFVTGCKEDTSNLTQPLASSDVGQRHAIALSENQLRLWRQNCALCHVDGNGGAPRLGHFEEWQPRLRKGNSVLLAHTIEGFNYMPPLGYCMACVQDDFSALIGFMSGELK
jgi:cytochrome c5